jgi:hypothetical protein
MWAAVTVTVAKDGRYSAKHFDPHTNRRVYHAGHIDTSGRPIEFRRRLALDVHRTIHTIVGRHEPHELEGETLEVLVNVKAQASRPSPYCFKEWDPFIKVMNSGTWYSPCNIDIIGDGDEDGMGEPTLTVAVNSFTPASWYLTLKHVRDDMYEVSATDGYSGVFSAKDIVKKIREVAYAKIIE